MAHARYLERHGDAERELRRTADIIGGRLIRRVRDRHWKVEREGVRVGVYFVSTCLAKEHEGALGAELQRRLAPHVAGWGRLEWLVYGDPEIEQDYARTPCLTFCRREDRVDWFVIMGIRPLGQEPLAPPSQGWRAILSGARRCGRRVALPFRVVYMICVWH